MDTGKLYSSDGEFISDVNYQLIDESKSGWWGELIPTEHRRIDDGMGYVVELHDGRKGSCALTKRVNRATMGVPPRYRYQFRGCSPFQ